MVTQIVEGFSVSHAQVLDGHTSWLDAVAAAAAEAEDIYGVNEASIDVNDDDYDNEGDDAVLSTWSWFNYADLSIQSGYLSFPLLANITNRPVEQINASAPVSEVQSMTAVGGSAGTYKITYNEQTTAPIAYNALAAAIQSALEALQNVGVGDIVVAGTGPITFTFSNDKAGTSQPLLVTDVSGVTGATGGVMTRTTAGHGATGQATAIDLYHEDSFNTTPKPALVVMPSKDNLGVPCRLLLGLYRLQFRPISFDGPKYKDGLKVNWNARAVMSSVDELGNPFPDGKKRCGKILSTVLA